MNVQTIFDSGNLQVVQLTKKRKPETSLILSSEGSYFLSTL